MFLLNISFNSDVEQFCIGITCLFQTFTYLLIYCETYGMNLFRYYCPVAIAKHFSANELLGSIQEKVAEPT